MKLLIIKNELKALEETTGIYANRTIDKDYINEDSIRIEIHKKVKFFKQTNRCVRI